MRRFGRPTLHEFWARDFGWLGLGFCVVRSRIFREFGVTDFAELGPGFFRRCGSRTPRVVHELEKISKWE